MNMTDSFIPFAVPSITEDEVQAAAEAIRSGWLTTGVNAVAFEREFAEYLEGEGLHAVAVNSATAALHLAVEAAGVGPGDEVLVPTWTFTATAEVVRYVGATPIFVDVNAETLNIDLDAASKKVTARTRAIIPVHFAGLPIPRDALGKFSKDHGLAVIEDAAHAFPVRDDGRFIGDSESAAVVFSFYATKTITTGEGGMLVTRNEKIAERARIMRLHGISRDVFDRYTSKTPAWQYSVVAPGFKYNLTDPAAAIGRVQLRRSEEMRQQRQAIATRYDAAFLNLPMTLPVGSVADLGHAHHLYVVRLKDEAPLSRDAFIEALADIGVGTSVHFIPLHMHPYWKETYDLRAEHYPVATRSFASAVSLPLFADMTDLQVERVTQAVRSLLS
ncbi:MAG TPA: UDP-4-amino-4,6-dideoxy-N-acetyl-beta-L-altrosamine transaminase [Microbacterium sp.]|nr:UDP-4-amino-4,6-dideoxy-N-acetyl-beta-L-altrosamine transaminase [Microbacterium sp.]